MNISQNRNLTSLKSNADKLDIDKLKNVPSKVDNLDFDMLVSVPVDLSKLSDVVKNDVAIKTEYNELVKKVNNISTTDSSNLVKKNWL